jgi:hypothetical protein
MTGIPSSEESLAEPRAVWLRGQHDSPTSRPVKMSIEPPVGLRTIMRDIDLLHKEVGVHGYPLGTHAQRMNSSLLDTLDDLSLH